MKLPTRFAELLAKDNGLNSLVLKALTVVEPWTADNKTVFFPEYTDHSLKHLEEVLLTAEGLILDESWPHLTAEDAAVTVLSVLLHDCALHLSEDGFYSLISGRYDSIRSRYVSEEPTWPLLWENFFAEAKRFDQRRLFALFGERAPVVSLPFKKLELTYKHRLLIGEFLRRHHARLAHEIALSGIPGPGQSLQVADAAYAELVDLAGFIARSHNLNLRKAVDRLEAHKRRVHLNCKVPFVMATLRIADYLQIHAARAPGSLLQLKSLASPVSRGEWSKHLSVEEINQAHDDPEAIFVDANPDSAKTFLAMRRLLSDMQLELDQSWAVLGEVYGRFAPLNALGIGIRRIRSNLDDSRLFQETRRPTYIPRDFRFKTASAELMDLLVAPLYGAKPEIGIRELVQNAVDACLERDDLFVKGLVTIDSRPKDDVVVSIAQNAEGEATLIVEDHGVGMTPEVVDRYFLNVGASFRSSDLWRKNHESGGHATIHRTGRFGIGLLAAFLLGPEIRVTTRHVSGAEEDAVTFTCTQGDETLEVSHCRFHFGTRIEIPLAKATAAALLKDTDEWDWYSLSNPTVRRTAAPVSNRDLPQRYSVPACDANLDGTPWRRISAEGFDDVLWSYEAFERWGNPDYLVICNGIYICRPGHENAPSISPELGTISALPPSLVIYDPDGRFPINLQRDKVLAKHITFARALALDVSEYLVKRLVEVFDRLPPAIASANIALSLDPKIPGLGYRSYSGYQTAYMILSKNGVVPADADLIREAGITCLLVDATNIAGNRGAFTSPIISKWVHYYCAVASITNTKSSRTQFLRASIGDSNYYGDPTGYFVGLNIVGRRILVRNSDIAELVRPGGVPRKLWKRLLIERDLGEWALWAVGDVPALDLDVVGAIAELEQNESFGFTLIYFGSATEPTGADTQDSQNSPFSDVWRQLVRSPVLHQRQG